MTLTTVTFSYTGSDQTFVVPIGVTSVQVEVWGAQGGSGRIGPSGHNEIGGLGAHMTATISVTPGETLGVHVGGQGSTYNGGGQAGPGWSAGGHTGGGGSDIRRGSALTDRLIVAGGGGGAGGDSTNQGLGGHGGDADFPDGIDGWTFGDAGVQGATDCGHGATTSLGGAKGLNNGVPSVDGYDGVLGIGGDCGHGGGFGVAAGGGGGGLYGGGGAAANTSSVTSGGGGGSSGAPGAGVSGVSGVGAARTGDGLITITFLENLWHIGRPAFGLV